jgi:hypothetical protein
VIGAALDIVSLALAVSAAACAAASCRWLAARSRPARPAALGAGSGAAAGSDGSGVTVGAAPAPLVSLLVPAREEARNIAGCVRGLLAQRDLALEALVLDDDSRDATGERALAAIAGDPRARLLCGSPIAAGWAGKGFACHQLAAAARGEWLFFLDADTRLAPGGAAAAIASAEAAAADLASFLPRFEGAHWTNRVLVPWLYFFLTALVPLPLVRRSPQPRLAVANGQAILVRRTAYDRIGGHAAVRDHVIEDVSLAIAAKSRGVAIALLDGSGWLSCAMYEGATGCVRGFAKSFHSAARRYPLQWAGLTVLLALVGVWPWLRLASGADDIVRPAAIGALAVVTATYAALLARFRQGLLGLAVWPFGLAVLIATAVGGGIAGLRGLPLEWRGRAVGGAAPS